MIEKLIENWLDRASERSYQPVFVQMLAAEGYTVLHSTRHCLLEFGKDVLAIAPDGVGCAFQLKGNPGGRLTVGEFRKEIQPQLVQLMAQTPSYPAFPAGPHRSYLVSNGQFEEEVQVAVREMNQSPFPSKAELWSRGHLYELCMKHGERLWPRELEDSRILLELYMLNPRGVLPPKLLDQVLTSILRLGDEDQPIGQSEYVRVASSATWITGIAAASFAEAQNHYSVALAWTQCCVALIGAAEKHASGDLRPIATSFGLAEAAVLDALAALWKEVQGREHLIEGDPLADIELLGWRATALTGLLTCLALAQGSRHLISEASASALSMWLTNPPRKLSIWGEAAIGSILPWCVWLRREVATVRPDEEIKALTRFLAAANQDDNPGPALPSPYYDAEQVLGMQLGLPKFKADQAETFRGSVYMAEPAMHLLVRTGLKQACKGVWPAITRVGHRSLDLASKSDYCRFKVRRGVEQTKMYPLTYQWKDLKQEALHGDGQSKVPAELAATPWLLSMWWQVAPHRLNSDSARVFADAVLPCWGH